MKISLLRTLQRLRFFANQGTKKIVIRHVLTYVTGVILFLTRRVAEILVLNLQKCRFFVNRGTKITYIRRVLAYVTNVSFFQRRGVTENKNIKPFRGLYFLLIEERNKITTGTYSRT